MRMTQLVTHLTQPRHLLALRSMVADRDQKDEQVGSLLAVLPLPAAARLALSSATGSQAFMVGLGVGAVAITAVTLVDYIYDALDNREDRPDMGWLDSVASRLGFAPRAPLEMPAEESTGELKALESLPTSSSKPIPPLPQLPLPVPVARPAGAPMRAPAEVRAETKKAEDHVKASTQPPLITVTSLAMPKPTSKLSILIPSNNIRDIIIEASNLVGVSPTYMLAKAAQEASFNPDAGAGTSTAKGLYQFIGTTWAEMVGKYGKKYGIGLGDIYDPRASAIMGALYAKENANIIERMGYTADPLNLYMAHFLGPGQEKADKKTGAVSRTGVRQFFYGLANTPNAAAADDMSAAASSNKPIFYKNYKKGADVSKLEKMSYADIYAYFHGRIAQKAYAYGDLMKGPASNWQGDTSVNAKGKVQVSAYKTMDYRSEEEKARELALAQARAAAKTQASTKTNKAVAKAPSSTPAQASIDQRPSTSAPPTSKTTAAAPAQGAKSVTYVRSANGTMLALPG